MPHTTIGTYYYAITVLYLCTIQASFATSATPSRVLLLMLSLLLIAAAVSVTL